MTEADLDPNILDQKFDSHTTNKCPLKRIVKDVSLIGKINDAVIRTNRIVIQIYQFLNMYLIHLFDKNEEFPHIDESFLNSIDRTITITKNNYTLKNEEGRATREKFVKFYNEQYKKCIIDSDVVSSVKLGRTREYEATCIVTNIETNISEHFMKRVNLFVDQFFDTRNRIRDITGEDPTEVTRLKREVYAEMRLVKADLIKVEEPYVFNSNMKYHEWLKLHKPKIIRKTEFKKNSVPYDVKCNPQDYLQSLFHMNKVLEDLSVSTERSIKLFQIIPQRTSIKPLYTTIDTVALIDLVITENITKYKKNIKEHQKELWSNHFKLNYKAFKRNNYKFNYAIKTDGIGCSITLERVDDGISGGKLVKLLNVQQQHYGQYIEDVEITDEMRSKRIVAIDPNMADLIYCYSKTERYRLPDGSEVPEKHHTFRYTQNQRRKEMKIKKYRSILARRNNEAKIKGKCVKEIEAELSLHNSKTVYFDKYQAYCTKKNEVNRLLFNHYGHELLRKLNLNTYINTQKSESKMIPNFQKKFGSPNECLIVYGDYEKEQHMKGVEPTISKRLRKIFRNHKYKIYMIDEFRTSKLCHECCGVCEKFMRRESHKPNDINKKTNKGKIIIVHGLVRCQNVDCNLIHNRDGNASRNMYKIAKSVFEGTGRPVEYQRSNTPHSLFTV